MVCFKGINICTSATLLIELPKLYCIFPVFMIWLLPSGTALFYNQFCEFGRKYYFSDCLIKSVNEFSQCYIINYEFREEKIPVIIILFKLVFLCYEIESVV
nr:hypothetical protein Itr_chr12CG18840 [Ipomoea trifida]